MKRNATHKRGAGARARAEAANLLRRVAACTDQPLAEFVRASLADIAEHNVALEAHEPNPRVSARYRRAAADGGNPGNPAQHADLHTRDGVETSGDPGNASEKDAHGTT